MEKIKSELESELENKMSELEKNKSELTNSGVELESKIKS